MVRTGNNAYLKYGWESTFAGAATVDKKFGLQDSLSSWSLTHNRQDLAALNQVTYNDYAYGQQAGSFSVDFVLSNPWIFRSMLGTPSYASTTWTYPHATNGINKTPQTFTTEIGFNASDSANGDIVRTLKGCVADSLSINTSVGGTVGCSLSATYGNEDEPTTTFGTAPTKPTVAFPYTFAHANFKWAGSVVAQVQDVSINIGQSSALLYGLNSNQAVDAYRQVLDISGSFRASVVNKNLLENMLDQISVGTGATYNETVSGSPALEISFTKSATEHITLTGTGLSPSDLSYDGIRPNEPIFESVNWRIKSLVVTAKNSQVSEE
ncbi:MAG: phage tail tube protein [Candidatus Nitrosotenuis sp.]